MRTPSATARRSNRLPVKNLSDYPGRPDLTPRPLVSVITTVRNGAGGLERTIDSVVQQNVPGLEYIVVDGGSTDGTIDIIRRRENDITYWQSEPDGGISDGFNKGLALAQGQYITLIHADDWFSPGQLAHGIATLERTGADFVFGDLIYFRDGEPAFRRRGDGGYRERIDHVMPALNHPTVIVRRSAYERHALFNTDYKLAMDYELLLRFHKAGLFGVYDPLLVGNMSLDGASDMSSRKALAEVRSAAVAHGYPATKAWILYGFRLMKDRLRRMSEKALPKTWHETLRGRVNSNYIRSE